jgi:phosphoribosylpyrophosphate synthetase
MSLDAVFAKARLVDDAPVGERLFHAAEVGEALERELANPQTLAATCQQLIAVANRLGCSRVLGASPLGERLAGAVVALAQNGIQEHGAGISGEHILVIDGLLVTGYQLAKASNRARAEGASRISAAVVAAIGEEPEGLRALTDDLIVLSR